MLSSKAINDTRSSTNSLRTRMHEVNDDLQEGSMEHFRGSATSSHVHT